MSDVESITQPAAEDREFSEEAPPIQTGSDMTTSLLRLLAGGVFEGGSLLRNWLNRDSATSVAAPDGKGAPDFGKRNQHAAVGFAFRSTDVARKNLKTAVRVSEKAGGIVFAPARRIMNTFPLRPVKNRFEALVARGEAEVEEWVQIGAAEENRSRELARDTVANVVDDVVKFLSTSPALEDLIKTQIDQLAVDLPQTTQIDVLVRVLANNYITYLNENPDEVQGLIRSQGDTYLSYLDENPEQVQTLIQGQSQSLIEDVTDEVREFMVTGDSFLELLARKLFRRPPRAELPGPPPEVQARAPYARMPGDFPMLGDGNDKADPTGTV